MKKSPRAHRSVFGRSLLAVVALAVSLAWAGTVQSAEQGEPIKMFNGKNLDGWKGLEGVWSVKDGAIVGTSVGKDLKANTFLVWQGGEPSDFRLTFKAKLEGNNNSGVQYRSKVSNPETWEVAGYQADIHPKAEYTAMLYGEGTGRGIIAQRGTKGVIETESGESDVDAKAFDTEPIDISEWHEYAIVVQGNRLIHQVDGKTTIELVDNHEKKLTEGIIALQVHRGPPMTVYFKDLQLEKLTDKMRE